MAYNTKNIIRDAAGAPVAQYYSPTSDQYEPLQGANGANRVLLYDANGNPLLTAANPGYVGATDGAIATLGALADAAQTSPTAAASVIALLKGLIKQLQGGGSGSAPTDVIDRAARVLGKISADDGAISTLGALANAAVTDPTVSASVVALLKGLLKQLQGNGAGSAPVQTTAIPLSSVVTLQNAATATGTGTPLPVSGYGVAVLAVSGTFTATITIEGQGPDGAWYAVGARKRGNSGITGTITTTGLFEVDCLGLQAIRANITSYTSGSVTVKGQSQALPPTSQIIRRSSLLALGLFGISQTIAANASYTWTLPDTTGHSGYCKITVTTTVNSGSWAIYLLDEEISGVDNPSVSILNITGGIGAGMFGQGQFPVGPKVNLRVVNTSSSNSMTISNIIVRMEG